MNSTNQKLVKYRILPWNLPFKKMKTPLHLITGVRILKLVTFNY